MDQSKNANSCDYDAACPTDTCTEAALAGEVTYSVALEQDIQVLCSFTVLVIIEGTLVNGVFPIRLRTIAAIEAFLPQCL